MKPLNPTIIALVQLSLLSVAQAGLKDGANRTLEGHRIPWNGPLHTTGAQVEVHKPLIARLGIGVAGMGSMDLKAVYSGWLGPHQIIFAESTRVGTRQTTSLTAQGVWAATIKPNEQMTFKQGTMEIADLIHPDQIAEVIHVVETYLKQLKETRNEPYPVYLRPTTLKVRNN